MDKEKCFPKFKFLTAVSFPMIQMPGLFVTNNKVEHLKLGTDL